MDALASLVDRGSNSSHTAVPNAFDLSKHESATEMLYAWIGLQLAGQVTLPILILTMLFHKSITRRNPTIINLCIVWTLATIPPELLFYAGKADGHNKPGPMLCLFQAATVSGVPPMAATAYLAVVIHACTIVYDIINANAIQPVSFNIRLILLLSSPYISFLTFSLLVAIIGAQHPLDVKPSLFFCEIEHHHLSIPVFGFALIVVVCTLVAQIWIAIMFYKHWQAKRKGNVSRRDVSPLDVGLLFRMVAFTAFEVVIIVSAVGTMTNPKMGAAKILGATPPFAVFLIFSSSPDIFRAWFPCCFRRKPKRSLADQASSTPAATNSEHGNDTIPSPMTSIVISHESQVHEFDLEKGNIISRSSSRPSTPVIFAPAPYSSSRSSRPGTRTLRPPIGPRPIGSSTTSI